MSENAQRLIYGDSEGQCFHCGETYKFAKSDAWNVEFYCCGECEDLDESQEMEADE